MTRTKVLQGLPELPGILHIYLTILKQLPPRTETLKGKLH